MGEMIVWSEEAKAELRAIDQLTAMRILRALADYRLTGEGDVSRLQAFHPPQYRLRVGSYRLRFRRGVGRIVVIAVGHRREVYR